MCRVAMRSKVSTATATAALPAGLADSVFSDVGAPRTDAPLPGRVGGGDAPIARDVGHREARVREPARGDSARVRGASGEREGRSSSPLLTFDGSKINLPYAATERAFPRLRTAAVLFQTSNASSARSMARASAAALFTVSWYSLSGSESATIPAPDCTWMVHSRRARFSASLESL